MSDSAEARTEWLQRVLGFTLPAPGGAPRNAAGTKGAAAGWIDARNAWREANDAVNDQINALRVALRAAADGNGNIEDADEYAEALVEIAENGLNAITEDHRVKLMAAVAEIGSGEPATMAKHGLKTLDLIEAFEDFLGKSEKIKVCDANSFGATVAIRDTLDPALQQMAASIRAAMAR